jgi:hypothetical protein
MRTNRTTRQVLALVVVTTALCADHVTTASPALRAPVATRDQMPPVVQLAGRLVSRLSQSFGRAVPSALPTEAQHPQPPAPQHERTLDDQSICVAPAPLSPFQFRLPPPTA